MVQRLLFCVPVLCLLTGPRGPSLLGLLKCHRAYSVLKLKLLKVKKLQRELFRVKPTSKIMLATLKLILGCTLNLLLHQFFLRQRHLPADHSIPKKSLLTRREIKQTPLAPWNFIFHPQDAAQLFVCTLRVVGLGSHRSHWPVLLILYRNVCLTLYLHLRSTRIQR